MTRKVFLFVALGAVLSGAVEAGDAQRARARLVWADFDGDGLEDVYVVRPEGRDSLFRNAGDGSLEEVTAQALPCVSCASLEVLWRDVDLDRRPDLLRLTVAGSIELLRNRGDGVFEDVTSAAGLERVGGASVARWLDYDADGRADLELTTESTPLVFHNLGDFLFEALTFDEIDGAPRADASPVRAIPGVLDDELGSPDAERTPAGDTSSGSHRTTGDAAALTGAMVDEVHPDALIAGTPPTDPLEPNPGVGFQLPPFANRCAWSVKDTSGGECVLTSTIPTLGKLYPISANLFVSTGGDVGIGTTSPAAKLDVAGTARITDTLTLAPSGDRALDVSTGSIYKTGLPFAHTRGGSGNTALGLEALAGVTTGTFDTAIGREALTSVTTGSANTASGYRALFSNTIGDNNSAHGQRALYSNTTGDNNTASGNRALATNTGGSNNTASGHRALHSNTTGDFNTASGYRALGGNTTGSYNTASGALALFQNAAGDNNTATGFGALRFNTGYANTAHGTSALQTNSTGNRNTANGNLALFSNSIGVRNSAFGNWALHSNTLGHRNTANGDYALSDNTLGDDNTASGHRSLGANTTGGSNTASGSESLRFNESGFGNTGIGAGAMLSNSTGGLNTALGFRTLWRNTSGSLNTASGSRALYFNTIGVRNTADGYKALLRNGVGSDNVAIGYKALYVIEGNGNIALGASAGRYVITGDDNIAIGNRGDAADTATIRIGTTGTHTRALVAGIHGVTTGVADGIPVLVDSAGQLGTVSSSRRFKKDIADMGERTERLLELRPVVFRYEQEQSITSGEVPVEYGLIAEEVAEIFPDLVVYDEEGLPFTVKYHLLSSMLLNELKEQSTELDGLKDQIEAQAERLAALESRSAPATPPSTLPVSNL